MEGLKRSKAEFLDSGPSDFISPFYKEFKHDDSKAPGQNYFSFINAPVEEKGAKEAKRPSRNERQQKIQSAKENFSLFLQKIVPNVDPDEFSRQKQNLLLKVKDVQVIPGLATVEEVHKEYLLGEKTRKNYKNKNWNELEIKLMIFSVLAYSSYEGACPDDLSDENWAELAKIFSNKGGQACKFKFNSLQRSHPTVQAWTPKEDELLRQIILEIREEERCRIKWADIAIKLNKLVNNNNIVRVGKHCRERWHNHLNPDLKKGTWSPEEDLILLEQSLILGKKWAKISKHLPGRNENSVKNRFITLARNFKGKAKVPELKKEGPFVQELKKMIQSLKTYIHSNSLNKSLEHLELNSEASFSPQMKIPTNQLDEVNSEASRSPSPEIKRPRKIENEEMEKMAEQPRQNPNMDALASPEIMQSLILNNYNNYLLYLQFLNSNVISPQPQLEKQYQDIQREIKSISQKDLYLNHLHFSSASSDNGRRGSGNTSQDPGSKRPSNSFTSIQTASRRTSDQNNFTPPFFRTPSMLTEFDENNNIKIHGRHTHFETSTNGDSHRNSQATVDLSKIKNKNKSLISLVVDEITESKGESSAISQEKNVNVATSWSNNLPTPTPISFPNISPLTPLNLGQDYFRFSPFIDNAKLLMPMTPIQSACKLEEEESPRGENYP